MEIIREEDVREESLLDVAKKMMTAARTAPKAIGVDNLVIAVAQRPTMEKIAQKMRQMVEEGRGAQFFLRDADNILDGEVLLLIGTKIKPMGLSHCGMCGFENCDEKDRHPDHPCAFNTGDLGIAIGSAVSVAADARVDNRVMFSVGKAVKEMKLLGEDVKIIYGIPLSAGGKNPFFDRK
ncbi:MAG TPA: ferredoxin [Clostridiales bacterium]|nr:ferredoxin [Clostridiales bacterium]